MIWTIEIVTSVTYLFILKFLVLQLLSGAQNVNSNQNTVTIITNPPSQPAVQTLSIDTSANALSPATLPIQILENDKITFAQLMAASSPADQGFQFNGEPRSSSHNAIEKRYRMSINDRIVELRELIAGKDSKVGSTFTDSVQFKVTWN